jgi:uncharacterized protein YcbX
MTALVQALSRYPIKGLRADPLKFIDFSCGQGVPGDRAFAFALPGNLFDEASPVAMRKTEFLTLARQEGLARLTVDYDHDTGQLSVTDGRDTISAKVSTPEGRSNISTFFSRFTDCTSPPRLVTAPGHSFTDVGVYSPEMMRAVSLINLASIRDLESKIKRSLDPRRFRANIVVDGIPAWSELEWVNREVMIGNVQFKGAWPTRRCPATQVNPDTAARDVNVPKELKRAYGHQNLGMYLHVAGTGRVQVGDVVAPRS